MVHPDICFLLVPQAEHEGSEPQEGIDWPLVVRTVARAGQQLGACRLARFAWAKLRTMPFPPDWRVCRTITWQHTLIADQGHSLATTSLAAAQVERDVPHCCAVRRRCRDAQG